MLLKIVTGAAALIGTALISLPASAQYYPYQGPGRGPGCGPAGYYGCGYSQPYQGPGNGPPGTYGGYRYGESYQGPGNGPPRRYRRYADDDYVTVVRRRYNYPRYYEYYAPY